MKHWGDFMSVWWHLLRGRREKGSSETTGPVSDLKHSGMSPIRAAVWETKAGSQQQGNVCGLKKKCVCAYHVVSNWQLRPYVDSFEGPETENLVSQSPHLAWGAWREVVVACCFTFLSKGPFPWMFSVNQERWDFSACFKVNWGPRQLKLAVAQIKHDVW